MNEGEIKQFVGELEDHDCHGWGHRQWANHTRYKASKPQSTNHGMQRRDHHQDTGYLRMSTGKITSRKTDRLEMIPLHSYIT